MKELILKPIFYIPTEPEAHFTPLAQLVLLLTPGQNVTGFKLKYFTCALGEQTTISGKQQRLKLTSQFLIYTNQFRKKKKSAK